MSLGFAVGSIAKVWKVFEDKGMTKVDLSIGRKKEDGTIDTKFKDGYVVLSWRALEKKDILAEKGVTIKIDKCDVQLNPNKNDPTKYYTNYYLEDFTKQKWSTKDKKWVDDVEGNDEPKPVNAKKNSKPEVTDEDTDDGYPF